jgi:pimeloyl-ACP methyl ester carboxylesterase
MAKRLISSCILFFIVIFFCGCGAPKKLISLVDIAEVKMVKVGDIDIAYKTFGHGEPLILIMGYTGTMDIWSPKVLNEFAKYYQVIIFDNRGMGLTSVGNKEFTIDLFGNDTAGLLDALNIKKANVLGWSMGTEIALSLTIGRPDKVDKLVLYAADCCFKTSVQPSPDVIKSVSSEDAGDKMAALRTLFPEKWLVENQDPRKYFPKITEVALKESIARQTKAMNDWDGVCDRLPTITQPTLLITGTDDILTPPQNSLNMVQKIPGAWLVQIEGGGHGMMFQYPKKFTEAVLVFLRD